MQSLTSFDRYRDAIEMARRDGLFWRDQRNPWLAGNAIRRLSDMQFDGCTERECGKLRMMAEDAINEIAGKAARERVA